jgi:hypothetical protein
MNATGITDDEYDRLVEAGKLIPLDEIARFCRPSPYDFDWDTAEYYRWYDCDSKPRPRPLDFDELVVCLIEQRGCSFEDAEREAAFESSVQRDDKAKWERLVKGELLQFA